MPQIGGKSKVSNISKKKSSSTKRHFTVVIGLKEHGLYVSSSPSSAARKAVSKLCATDKKRKVRFHIREITQGSKKKTYGPYFGYIEKLAKPIELKGRVIKYKPIAKLSGKPGAKKVMTGGAFTLYIGDGDGEEKLPYFEFIIDDQNLIEKLKERFNKFILLLYKIEECCISSYKDTVIVDTRNGFKLKFTFSKCVTQELLEKFLSDEELKQIIRDHLDFNEISNVFINIYIPYKVGASKIIIYRSFEVLRYGEISEEVKINNTINNTLYLLNPGIETLTLEICKHYFYLFISHFNDYFMKRIKIISVGSGNAFFESIVRNNVFENMKLRLDIVCVDPNPDKFIPHVSRKNLFNASFTHNKRIFIQPKFPTVQELISTNSRIVENCFLMLIWPDPNLSYDLEAILLLKPIGIFIIYTIPLPDEWNSRLSGSRILIEFLNGSYEVNDLSYRMITSHNIGMFSVAIFEKN
jgi:hypothetical protein